MGDLLSSNCGVYSQEVMDSVMENLKSLKAEKIRKEKIRKATEEARRKRTWQMHQKRQGAPRGPTPCVSPEARPELTMELPPRNPQHMFATSHNLASSSPHSPLKKLEQTVQRMREAAADAAFSAPFFCNEAREDIEMWASELGPHRLAWEVHCAGQTRSTPPMDEMLGSPCHSPTLATSVADSQWSSDEVVDEPAEHEGGRENSQPTLPRLCLPALTLPEDAGALCRALKDKGGVREEELYLRRVALLERGQDCRTHLQAKWDRMVSLWRWQGNGDKTFTIRLA